VTEQEFTTIHNRLQDKVYRLCLGYFGGDTSMAQEISQQAFIKVWNHRNNFKGDSEISTWVYRIAVNCCLGELRKKKPRRLSIDHSDIVPTADYEQPVDSNQDLQQLYHCIDQLKPINKSVILMELEEIPQQQIAQTLGYSHGSIRTRLSRIREALLKCMTHGK
jgi:RNA polymerase sigma-70 factor (ECF subfamily)